MKQMSERSQHQVELQLRSSPGGDPGCVRDVKRIGVVSDTSIFGTVTLARWWEPHGTEEIFREISIPIDQIPGLIETLARTLRDREDGTLRPVQ
jgi:hypothetical protein